MRHRIEVAHLYARARNALPDAIDGQPPLPVPEDCRATLDQLLFGDEALGKLLFGED